MAAFLITARRATKMASATYSATAFLLFLNEIRSVAAFAPARHPHPEVTENLPEYYFFLTFPQIGSDSIPAEKLRFRRFRQGPDVVFSTRSPEYRNHPPLFVRGYNQHLACCDQRFVPPDCAPACGSKEQFVCSSVIPAF